MGYIPNPIPIVIVKVVGYTVAGVILNKIFKKDVFPVLFGIVRTVSGLTLGLLTIALSAIISPYLWYVGLRIVVWYILIWYFYERKGISDKWFRIALLIGIGWSFLIDVILYWIFETLPDSMRIPMC